MIFEGQTVALEILVYIAIDTQKKQGKRGKTKQAQSPAPVHCISTLKPDKFQACFTGHSLLLQK